MWRLFFPSSGALPSFSLIRERRGVRAKEIEEVLIVSFAVMMAVVMAVTTVMAVMMAVMAVVMAVSDDAADRACTSLHVRQLGGYCFKASDLYRLTTYNWILRRSHMMC